MLIEKKELNSYAYLPEDLLIKILERTPETVKKLSQIIGANNDEISQARYELLKLNRIKHLSSDSFSESLIAVDGANIIERMAGADLALAIAVGVEGLPKDPSMHWTTNSEQYYEWQDALPHHVANSRLTQGIMFLMELSILASSNHEFRIMDGGHITSILKINSLLSAYDTDFADQSYVNALSNFLEDNYNRIIPDIPDILDSAFGCEKIIGLVKYSSSREMLGSYPLKNLNIPGDDKTFFSLALNEMEYTSPLPVGQTEKDESQWEMIHIKCNLEGLGLGIKEVEKLNSRLDEVVERFRPTRDSGTELYFSYFKPYETGLCFRVEMKKKLAEDTKQLEKLFCTLRNQTFSPEIHEPYPQFLADIIAKNISFGMGAMKQAVTLNPLLTNNDNFNLLMSYRS